MKSVGRRLAGASFVVAHVLLASSGSAQTASRVAGYSARRQAALVEGMVTSSQQLSRSCNRDGGPAYPGRDKERLARDNFRKTAGWVVEHATELPLNLETTRAVNLKL